MSDEKKQLSAVEREQLHHDLVVALEQGTPGGVVALLKGIGAVFAPAGILADALLADDQERVNESVKAILDQHDVDLSSVKDALERARARADSAHERIDEIEAPGVDKLAQQLRESLSAELLDEVFKHAAVEEKPRMFFLLVMHDATADELRSFKHLGVCVLHLPGLEGTDRPMHASNRMGRELPEEVKRLGRGRGYQVEFPTDLVRKASQR